MKNKERVIYDFICGITDEQAEKLIEEGTAKASLKLKG